MSKCLHSTTHEFDGKQRCSRCGAFVYGDIQKLLKASKVKTVPYPAPKIRTVGEIWDIPKSVSPMWTRQWGYQGSSKTPYIISHNPERINGSTTSEGWACSCPSFTRHTPRTPCKHILNVMLQTGQGGAQEKSQAKVANASQSETAEFEKWKREKAAAAPKEPAKDVKLNFFGVTGRKFR